MRTEPRISFNKFMEYIRALPSRQREIVDDQKNPLANKPKMAWCANARKKIIEFIAGGCSDESILDKEIERLTEMKEEIENIDGMDKKKRKNKIHTIQVEIDAINAFKNVPLKVNGFLFSRPPRRPKYLDYSGVHVSVSPELVIRTKGFEYVGCVKLYFTKNTRLNEEDADFMCAFLNHYTDRYLSTDHLVQPEACIVIDVFGEKIFTTSENVPLHLGRIRKSCEEIRETWRKIPKRKSIGGKDDDSQLEFPE